MSHSRPARRNAPSLPEDSSSVLPSDHARSAGCLLRAQSDEQACDEFLEIYAASPNTYRAYEREVSRFLLWTREFAFRRFADLSVEDMRDFDAWLQNPPEHLVGPAKKALPRSSPEWRPFRGPLNGEPLVQAKRIVGTLLGWLADAGYLNRSPMRPLKQRTPKLAVARGTTLRNKRVERHGLSAVAIATISDWLNGQPKANPREVESALRNRLLFECFLGTGARRTELANASTNNLACEKGRWWLYVQQKGGGIGKMAIANNVLASIRDYRVCRGLSEMPAPNEVLPLIARLRRPDGWLTDNMIYRLMTDILQNSADLAKSRGDEATAEQLKNASTHWLRHTAISSVADKTGNIRLTREFGRHASADTTMGYLSNEETEYHDRLTPVIDGLIKR